MGMIKIINDSGKCYKKGEIVKCKDIISDYCDICNDESVESWLYKIPIPNAINFIAGAWGIDYEFV